MKVNNAHGKRKNVRFLVLLLAMVIAAILPVTASAASTVRLNRKKVTLTVGKTARLKVTGTRRTVKWSSSDKKVATVSKKGKLTGKKKGSAVLCVGEDLDVLLDLCDRILVLAGGRISGIVDARTSTKEELGILMTGGKEEA